MLRRAGLGLLVGAMLSAPTAAIAGPALVFEPYNGTVFYSEDPDAPWFPASLTKMMTAYVAFQAIKKGEISPDTNITCSKHAVAQAPSKLGLPVGGQITLETALKVLIVKSANDVAVMVAEAVAGSEDAFVQRMNDTARKLGMTRTHYANANGLPNENRSPPRAISPSSPAPSSSTSPNTPTSSPCPGCRSAKRCFAAITGC